MSIEQLRATYDKSQIRTQNAVKDKTSNSFEMMGQTIGKYQQA
jgi:hypothetical protein